MTEEARESEAYLGDMRRQREETWRKLPLWTRWLSRRGGGRRHRTGPGERGAPSR